MNKKIALTLATLAAIFIWVGQTAHAQMILVNQDYRITHIDRATQRLGVCLVDADPNVRQNWVYIKTNTVITRRVFFDNGSFKDETMDWSSFFSLIKKGDVIKVHGGRDWDMSIDAKHIWIQ